MIVTRRLRRSSGGRFAVWQGSGARELQGLKMLIVPGSQLHQLPEGLDSTEFAAPSSVICWITRLKRLRAQEGDNTIELFTGDEGDEVVIGSPTRGCGVPEALREKF